MSFGTQVSTRAVKKKYPTFGRENTLTRLEVCNPNPLQSSLLVTEHASPTPVPPLFEAFLDCLFANGVQLGCRFTHNVVSWLKSSAFQLHFQVGEQPKITGSLSNHRNVVFGQESLNQLRGMSWCVVVIQLPRFADTLRMDKSLVKMEYTEPMLIPTSSASSRTVTRWSCMTRVRTWSMSSSFRFVERLPERASLSTDYSWLLKLHLLK
jgi:hypothetical protein